MGQPCDRLIEWLMRPRVRRLRRWSFVATVPAGLLAAHFYGAHQGLAIVLGRLAISVGVAALAWRLGGDRGDAVRDLLMHPRLRAFGRAEADVLTALPRLLLGRRGRSGGAAGLAYWRGTFGLAVGLALTPVIASEALILHLLLRGIWVAWASTAVHAYSLVWLWGFVLGPRCYPHRVGPRTAVLRAGPMYRVLVPRSTIVSVSERRERTVRNGLLERDGSVLLPVRGRVEVWLELSQPVRVQRPMHEPIETHVVAIASDDPRALIDQLMAPVAASRSYRDSYAVQGGLGVLAALDIAGMSRDAAQPG
ncbi:MAG: hypothetical protein QOH12_2141 [Solirubrobacteraceae bacterium]|jgi:hypothetical protein|nr:hypothetical protein [Solirubrobacteraceae bacterium]